jgi:hypothetical protein
VLISRSIPLFSMFPTFKVVISNPVVLEIGVDNKRSYVYFL